MVVFTCGRCGDSLKKKEVEKHFKCRKPLNLTCVDCLKDFGDDYVKHTICISEKDRYSSNGLSGLPAKQKSKQELWVETVHTSCSKAIDDGLPGITPSILNLLTWLQDQLSIPDKLKTFSNYCQNSRRGEPMANIQFVWNILDKARSDLQAKLKAEREAAEAEKRAKRAEHMKNKKHDSSSDSSGSDSEDEAGSKAPKNGADEEPKQEAAFEVVQSKRDKKKKRMVSESESVINGTSENTRKTKKSKKNPETEDSDSSNLNNALDACHLNGVIEEEKLSKKERKEKKKREKYEAELKKLESAEPEEENEPEDEPMEEVVEETETKKSKKKKSKDEPVEEAEDNESKKGKKKKRNRKNTEETAPVDEEPTDSKDKKKEKKSKKQQRQEEAELLYADKPEKKGKTDIMECGKLNETLKADEDNGAEFSWDTAILQVLESQSDHEISMKKLSKKVLNEYLISVGDDAHLDEAKIINKFHKKLQKMHNVLVHKDKVRLKTSRD